MQVLRKLALTVLLSSAAAAQGATVPLDPLPFGTVQLGFGQYMIPQITGATVLVYAPTNLTVAQPGEVFRPKATLNLASLPFGTIRMNQNQYMVPGLLPGATVLVISASPLTIMAPPSVEPVASTFPTTAAVPLNAPAPAATLQALPAAPAGASGAPVAVLAAATPTAAPLSKPAPAVAAPAAAATGVSTPAAPVQPVAAQVPSPPINSTAAVTEVRSPSVTTFPGLPESLRVSINSVEKAGMLTISYALTNLGSSTFVLNPTDLLITQDGVPMRATLNRRNGSLQPGTLSPRSGEIGTITVPRISSGPLTLRWLVREGDATHVLTHTVTPVLANR